MSLITINITNSTSIKNAWKKSFWWDKTAYCLSFILPLCRLLLTCIYNKEIYLIIYSSDIPAILVFGLSVSCSFMVCQLRGDVYVSNNYKIFSFGSPFCEGQRWRRSSGHGRIQIPQELRVQPKGQVAMYHSRQIQLQSSCVHRRI